MRYARLINFEGSVPLNIFRSSPIYSVRREVWKTLKKLKEQGMTIFLTTHYMEEAENLCDRVCLIRSGKKVTEETVAEVIGSSPYENLEEAYLWDMDEEVE